MKMEKIRDMPSRSLLHGVLDRVFRRKRWHVVADLINHYGLKNYIEVGVEYGDTMAYVERNCPAINIGTATVIDDYAPYEGVSKELQDTRYNKAFKRLYGKCCFWRVTSEHAAMERNIKEGSRDIVFIDANHSYENVKKDIGLWWPKIRAGGILIGHDYSLRCMGVVNAVTERFGYFYVSDDNTWWVRKG